MGSYPHILIFLVSRSLTLIADRITKLSVQQAVWSSNLLLTLARTVIIGFRPCGIHDHIVFNCRLSGISHIRSIFLKLCSVDHSSL
jgi:hypothetical protein